MYYVELVNIIIFIIFIIVVLLVWIIILVICIIDIVIFFISVEILWGIILFKEFIVVFFKYKLNNCYKFWFFKYNLYK